MHIISKKRLVSAGERYAKILPALMRWFRVAGKARWNDIHETRADFPHADPVGKFTVFNIKNNEYRLIRARKLIIVTNDAHCVTLSVWAQQKNLSGNTACCFRT